MSYTNLVEFRKKAFQSLLSILFFIVIYIMLILSGIALTGLCIYAGMALIIFKPMLITIGLGIGIMGMGVLVLIFLFKFIFKNNKVDRSGMTEIFEKDEPKLFNLIRNLSEEIKTEFPKRIYVTPEVNASVFYDSSFWSMIFPVKKNLQIGLGLVNSVTESELKAILAHEFGHFSQKSMKIGSYVYNVNQIIYNLLYDNESYESMVQQWANVSQYFALFAGFSVKIVKGIQWILQKTYGIVNINYMGLSREMEFHADEIAASVAGSDPLISSLMRLEFADSSYNNVVNFYNDQIQESNKTDNIYPQHSYAMNVMAKNYKLEYKNTLPVITEEIINKFNKSLLVIKDQWASHPSTKERVIRLKKLNIQSTLINESAWNYFNDKEKIQRHITDQLFKSVIYPNTPNVVDLAFFEKKYSEHINKLSFDERYAGFYDSRDISNINLDKADNDSKKSSLSKLEDLFNEESVGLLNDFNGLVNDINLLEQINSGGTQIKSYDYDGKKFKSKDSKDLLERLTKQKEVLENKLNEIDKKSYAFFFQRAQIRNAESILKEKYNLYFKEQETYTNDLTFYYEMINSMQFMHFTNSFDQIRSNMKIVKEKEVKLKSRLRQLQLNIELQDYLDQDTITKLKNYLSQEWNYFTEPSYNDKALELLNIGVNSFITIVSRKIFLDKKSLLDYQLGLLGE